MSNRPFLVACNSNISSISVGRYVQFRRRAKAVIALANILPRNHFKMVSVSNSVVESFHRGDQSSVK